MDINLFINFMNILIYSKKFTKMMKQIFISILILLLIFLITFTKMIKKIHVLSEKTNTTESILNNVKQNLSKKFNVYEEKFFK